MEINHALRDIRLPTSTYEGSAGDMKDWNEAQVLNRIDSSVESLGLSRLGD
jgi:hypothetical protein